MKNYVINVTKSYFSINNFSYAFLIAMILSVVGALYLISNYNDFQNELVIKTNAYQQKAKLLSEKKAQLAKLQKEVNQLEEQLRTRGIK